MTVEIIGRSCHVAGASSPDELFTLLREGRSAVSEIPNDRWDKARYWHPQVGVAGKAYTFAAGVVTDAMDFDAAVFGMSAREAEGLDPQQRLLLRMTWRALEDANLTASFLQTERVGVYVGASSLENANMIVGDPAAASPYFMTGNTLSVISNRVSHILGIRGPSMTVDTACSSGLVALDLAVRALEVGDIETAIVGSVNVLSHPLSFVGFCQARMLSPYGQCRAYDNRAEGYVRAEGGAVFILRRSDRAKAHGDRSHARIIATGVNSAGHTNGISLPSREAQAALLKTLYESHDIDVGRLAFVEGHGTGTRVGDPAEVWALGTAIARYRRAALPIGSIKSNIGHTEPASGLLGLMKATLALEHDFLPASLHFDRPNDQIDFVGLNISVAADPIELLPSKRARYAGVNSFGFGGTNVHVVISDPEAVEADRTGQKSDLLLVTAQSSASLRELLTAYRGRIARTPKADMPRLLSSVGANRQHLRYRFAVHAPDQTTVLQAIDGYLAGREGLAAETGVAALDQAKTVFVFSGNGSQWSGMALDALRHNKLFRERFEVLDALFNSASGIHLSDLLVHPGLANQLSDTRIAQPLLFATQVAAADSLIALGLRPSAAYGHSIGEVAAAYVAGAISIVDAVTIVAKRSRHQHKLAGQGKMAAVAMAAAEAVAMARSAGLDEIHAAAANTHNAATVSGPANQIDAFFKLAGANHVAAQILDIDYPFHHPLIDAARDDFLADLSPFELRATRIPFISTITGDVLDGEYLTPNYWWRNIRETVCFQTSTEKAIDLGGRVFLEVGPRPILLSYLRETIRLRDRGGAVAATLVKGNRSESDPIRKAFSRALSIGAEFDVDKVFGQRNAAVSLPPLPFEMTPHRAARTSEALDLYGEGCRDVHTLIGWRVDSTASAWHNIIDAFLHPDLAQHVVDGRPILPGSAYLDMALAAARRHHNDASFEITNLEILHPMDLSQSRTLEVSTVISQETGRIEIKSRERLKEEEWTTHVVARTRASSIPIHWIEPVEGVAMQTIDASDVYRTSEQFLLDYGPSFRLLDGVVRRGVRYVEVALKPAPPPAHPFLSHELNPMSTDAAFHGLVGLFKQFATDSDIAPYIPVHFGAVQLHLPGVSIASAAIVIERISAYSVKANVRLLDADRRPVATLLDCRLRRSRIKPQKSLAAQSFHYERIASDVALGFGPASDAGQPRAVRASIEHFRPWAAQSRDVASRILAAAVYRGCYDVALGVANKGGRVPEFASSHDPLFTRFLAACLLRLEDAGLATYDDHGWQVARECALPRFDDLIVQFLREDPGRSVEAVLLNDAYWKALGHTSVAADPSLAGGKDVSDTTLEHAISHSPAILGRWAMVADALTRAVDAHFRSGGAPVTVVELGAVSKSASRRFAEIVAAGRGRLVIVEANERLRNELELAFQNDVRVDVVARCPSRLSADLVVSVSENAFGALKFDGPDRSLVAAILAGGGAFIGCFDGPNPFSDFVFGLRNGWFSGTTDVSFPIGKLASQEDWQRLGQQLGAGRSTIASIETETGTGVAVSFGVGSAPLMLPNVAPNSAVMLFVDAPSLAASTLIDFSDRICLRGDSALDGPVIAAALAAGTAHDVALFVAGDFGLATESLALQANVDTLSVLARELNGQPKANGHRLSLGVLLPCGSPFGAGREGVTFAPARNAGLWSFLRVVRNEYPDLEIHTFDLACCQLSLAEQSMLAAAVCRSGSSNREWSWDEGASALCEVRIVPGPAPKADLLVRGFGAATVPHSVMSNLSNLKWESFEPRALEPHEVRIRVAATALNYRDVMWAVGMLPEEALEDGFAGSAVGMECSGRIVETGSAVSGLASGDLVMAVATSAFSTEVVTSAQGVAKLPDSVSPVAGATLPVAFLTAYYALVELARLREGETVLVHGGAGGVGLAALQVAKAYGAKVIATASTTEKRRLLTALGADHVLDSRTLGFTGEVMALTRQAGVDVVLNSLFGDAMERSISVLKPFGRFLELGKRDYYSDTKIGLRPFRQNISYFGIDADQLLKLRPDLTARLFRDIAALFAAGKLSPIPYRAFAYTEVRDAFRLMQGSGHIGKIVVTPPVPGRDAVFRPKADDMALSQDGIYVVVGGTSGFGLSTAKWLVERGARALALCSRSGVLDENGAALRDRLLAAGISVGVHSCDVTDEAKLGALLETLRAKAPLRGIVHAAMVLDDALLPNLNRERNRPVIEVKARGAELLDRLTRQDQLDTFLLFSSITTLVGNPGQANYVAGNGFLEGLARARRTQGLPAIAAAFGAISDVGHLVQNESAKAVLGKRLGKFAFTAREALEKLREFIAYDPGTVDAACVAIADVSLRAAQSLPVVNSPLFSVALRSTMHQPIGITGDQLDLATVIEGKSPKEAEQLIFALIATEFASALRVPVNEIGRLRTVREIGIDSLMAMELGLNFQQKTGYELALSNLSESTTIGDISHKLYLRVSGTTETPARGADAALVEKLAERHVGDGDMRIVNV